MYLSIFFGFSISFDLSISFVNFGQHLPFAGPIVGQFWTHILGICVHYFDDFQFKKQISLRV